MRRELSLGDDNPLQEQNAVRGIIVDLNEELIELRKTIYQLEEPIGKDPLIHEITADALAGNTARAYVEGDKLGAIRSFLKDVEAFESSGLKGPLGFLMGLYYFVGIRGQQLYGAWAHEIAAKLRADWPMEVWREQFKYLRPAGVLRLDEEGLGKISSVLDNHGAS